MFSMQTKLRYHPGMRRQLWSSQFMKVFQSKGRDISMKIQCASSLILALSKQDVMPSGITVFKQRHLPGQTLDGENTKSSFESYWRNMSCVYLWTCIPTQTHDAIINIRSIIIEALIMLTYKLLTWCRFSI